MAKLGANDENVLAELVLGADAADRAEAAEAEETLRRDRLAAGRRAEPVQDLRGEHGRVAERQRRGEARAALDETEVAAERAVVAVEERFQVIRARRIL